MIEIDDYNGDYFFEQEENGLEYQSILDNYEEPSPQDKDASYNIFTLEQAVSVINEIGKINSTLNIASETANQSLCNLINIYTKQMNGEL